MPTMLRESGDMGLVSRIAALQDKTSFKELHWEGTFEDYLRIVRENPRVTRTAFQRIYDMILSHGKTEYIDNKKRLIRYHFFHDEPNGGRDGEARHPAARSRRIVEEHHRPPAQEGPRGVLAHAGRRALHVLLGAGEEGSRRPDAHRALPHADERGSVAPHPGGVAREGV